MILTFMVRLMWMVPGKRIAFMATAQCGCFLNAAVLSWASQTTHIYCPYSAFFCPRFGCMHEDALGHCLVKHVILRLCANQPSLHRYIENIHEIQPLKKGCWETWTSKRGSLSSPHYTCPVLRKEQFLFLNNVLRFAGTEIPRFGPLLALRAVKLQVSGVLCQPGCVASPMWGGREASVFILDKK